MRVIMLVVSLAALLAVIWCAALAIDIVQRDESLQWMLYPIAFSAIILAVASASGIAFAVWLERPRA